MTDTAPDTQPSTLEYSGGIIRNTLRLLFANYWQFALLGVGLVVVRIFVRMLNFIPLLGQLLSMFLMSLAFSIALLIALNIARRAASPFSGPLTSLSGPRLLELAIVMVPVGLIEVFSAMVSQAALIFGIFGGMATNSFEAFHMTHLVFAVIIALLKAWAMIKFAFAPFYVAAVPAEASAAPVKRMRQSMSLSRGRALPVMLAYLVITFGSAFFDLVPVVGTVIIAAALMLPLQLAGLIVIYHRLTGRGIEGLARRERTVADKAADDIAPI